MSIRKKIVIAGGGILVQYGLFIVFIGMIRLLFLKELHPKVVLEVLIPLVLLLYYFALFTVIEWMVCMIWPRVYSLFILTTFLITLYLLVQSEILFDYPFNYYLLSVVLAWGTTHSMLYFLTKYLNKNKSMSI